MKRITRQRPSLPQDDANTKMSTTFTAVIGAGYESRSRGVLDPPLEPVIGLAKGETRWRRMTTGCDVTHEDQR
jgi:hypothetical protein